MNNATKVKYYINPPTYIYADNAQLYFTGFLDSKDDFSKLDVMLNGKIIGSSKLQTHYQKEYKKFTNSAFTVNVSLSENELKRKTLFLELIFLKRDGAFVFKLPGIALKEFPPKIEAKNTNEIAILLPVYNPDIESFEKQLNSILKQSHSNFKIIIQDDFSEASKFEVIKKIALQNTAIHLSRNKKNLGFYKNIENMLYAVAPSFAYICFADQDDEWMPDKLEKQLKFITEKKADFVYSNLKISTRDGEVISNSFWNNRSNHINDFKALIQNNCATGSTIMFKTSLLKFVLPFPTQIGKVYHDHWICAKSKSIAKVAYQDEILVNYIQHENNVTGFHKFKKYSIIKRLKEFLSLLIVCAKVVLIKDTNDFEHIIEANQKIYFVNYQRIKLFYVKLKNYNVDAWQTDLKIATNTLFLSVKTLSSKYFFNRSEVAIYSAIIFNFALNIRNYIRK